VRGKADDLMRYHEEIPSFLRILLPPSQKWQQTDENLSHNRLGNHIGPIGKDEMVMRKK